MNHLYDLVVLIVSTTIDCSPYTGLMSPSLKGHNGTIRVVKFQQQSAHTIKGDNNVLLASAGAGDCSPRVWDINTGIHSLLFESYCS